MNKRSGFGILTVLILSALPLMARQTERSTTAIEPDYIVALGTANQFLSAWQRRDQKAGLILISARLKSTQTESDLRMYMSGLSSPHHEAFEISGGQRLVDGNYAFNVRLYEYLPNSKDMLTRPKVSRIILKKIGDTEWRVDALP